MSFSTTVRTSRKGCMVALFQRICCFLAMRLATISSTALSTNAVEMVDRALDERRRDGLAAPATGGVVHQGRPVALEVAQQLNDASPEAADAGRVARVLARRPAAQGGELAPALRPAPVPHAPANSPADPPRAGAHHR